MVFSAFAFDLQFFCTPTYLLTLEDLDGAHIFIDDDLTIYLNKYFYFNLFYSPNFELSRSFIKDLFDLFLFSFPKLRNYF